MDFFGRQVETRRLSRRLVVLFLLAVIAVALAITCVVLVVARLLDPGIKRRGPARSVMAR